MSDGAQFVDDTTGAIISDDETYRYQLWRTWDAGKSRLGWVMLNPSTADETEDDPTIRRCVNYAKEWGYGSIVVGNLFALRATDPDQLRDHPDPVGPHNDYHLEAICEEAERVVAAWGATYDTGLGFTRRINVTSLLGQEAGEFYALDTTKEGHPVHPLYQPADAELQRYADTERSRNGAKEES